MTIHPLKIYIHTEWHTSSTHGEYTELPHSSEHGRIKHWPIQLLDYSEENSLLNDLVMANGYIEFHKFEGENFGDLSKFYLDCRPVW